MKPILRLPCGLLLGLALLWPGAASAVDDFSESERAIFLDKHLATLKPPLTLRYDFRRSGTLEPAFADMVDVMLKARDDASCCVASARFLTGAREVRQPEIDGAQGNPVVLYFLERDIREMQRLTKGQANYFRKRIRMAVYQGASVRKVMLPYRGAPVEVQEIDIAPYLDDPNRSRFGQFVGKRYVFLLARAVPGGVYGIRTRVDGQSADAPPLLVEEMLIDGAGPAAPQRQP